VPVDQACRDADYAGRANQFDIPRSRETLVIFLSPVPDDIVRGILMDPTFDVSTGLVASLGRGIRNGSSANKDFVTETHFFSVVVMRPAARLLRFILVRRTGREYPKTGSRNS
jgi:hypothetical protein